MHILISFFFLGLLLRSSLTPFWYLNCVSYLFTCQTSRIVAVRTGCVHIGEYYLVVDNLECSNYPFFPKIYFLVEG